MSYSWVVTADLVGIVVYDETVPNEVRQTMPCPHCYAVRDLVLHLPVTPVAPFCERVSSLRSFGKFMNGGTRL